MQTATDRQQEITERLEAALDAVYDSDSFRDYLALQSRFHSYSYANVLLIAMQRPQATRVAGFRQWLRLGRSVRKGEHGITIYVPHIRQVEDEDGGLRQSVRFGFGTVFDISQTDGEPLPVLDCPVLRGDDGADLWERLAIVAAQEGVLIDIRESVGDSDTMGWYNPTEKVIAVKAADQAQMTKTLAHELGHHFTGMHETYTAERQVHETVAEAVAYIVCAHYGLDTGDRSLPYIAGWSRERAAFKAALATIQRVSRTMIEKLEEN